MGPDLLTLLPARKETILEPYGFHGFSFEYLLEELNHVAGDGAAQGRVILAHLDSRKSVGAYRNGKPIDFNEDITAPYSLNQDTLHTSGLRTQSEKNNAPLFASSTNQETASPMASVTDFKTIVLTDDQSKDTEENTRRFCYDTRKCIGSLAAALEGLDTLVFTGSIGEHGPDVRSTICDSLAFLGIDLDEVKNMNNEYIVSTETSAVTVRIIKTNEEIIMARLVSTILDF